MLLSRRRLAHRLVAKGPTPATWRLLGATVRSGEDWRLRARCLECWGWAAGSTDRQTAKAILDALAAREPSP